VKYIIYIAGSRRACLGSLAAATHITQATAGRSPITHIGLQLCSVRPCLVPATIAAQFKVRYYRITTVFTPRRNALSPRPRFRG